MRRPFFLLMNALIVFAVIFAFAHLVATINAESTSDVNFFKQLVSTKNQTELCEEFAERLRTASNFTDLIYEDAFTISFNTNADIPGHGKHFGKWGLQTFANQIDSAMDFNNTEITVMGANEVYGICAINITTDLISKVTGKQTYCEESDDPEHTNNNSLVEGHNHHHHHHHPVTVVLALKSWGLKYGVARFDFPCSCNYYTAANTFSFDSQLVVKALSQSMYRYGYRNKCLLKYFFSPETKVELNTYVGPTKTFHGLKALPKLMDWMSNHVLKCDMKKHNAHHAHPHNEEYSSGDDDVVNGRCNRYSNNGDNNNNNDGNFYSDHVTTTNNNNDDECNMEVFANLLQGGITSPVTTPFMNNDNDDNNNNYDHYNNMGGFGPSEHTDDVAKLTSFISSLIGESSSNSANNNNNEFDHLDDHHHHHHDHHDHNHCCPHKKRINPLCKMFPLPFPYITLCNHEYSLNSTRTVWICVVPPFIKEAMRPYICKEKLSKLFTFAPMVRVQFDFNQEHPHKIDRISFTSLNPWGNVHGQWHGHNHHDHHHTSTDKEDESTNTSPIPTSFPFHNHHVNRRSHNNNNNDHGNINNLRDRMSHFYRNINNNNINNNNNNGDNNNIHRRPSRS